MAIDLLNEKRLYNYNIKYGDYKIELPDFKKERFLTCYVPTSDDYNKLDKRYDVIYSDDKIDKCVLKLPRVIHEYPNYDGSVMIGEIGGIDKYKETYTDFSLNVVNSYTVAFLHSLGVKRITLSYELDDNQIKDIINNYHKRYNVNPNLELIVSANEEVMISKFSLNKY